MRRDSSFSNDSVQEAFTASLRHYGEVGNGSFEQQDREGAQRSEGLLRDLCVSIFLASFALN